MSDQLMKQEALEAFTLITFAGITADRMENKLQSLRRVIGGKTNE